MKKYFGTTLVFLLAVSANAQMDIRPYEQVAIDYLIGDLENSHPDIKYFIFDGVLETIPPNRLFLCMPFEEIHDYEGSQTTKINPPYPQVIRKLGLVRKIFISKRKVGYFNVYKHYPLRDSVVVVIHLSKKGWTYTYSLLIDPESKHVVDSCKMTFFE